MELPRSTSNVRVEIVGVEGKATRVCCAKCAAKAAKAAEARRASGEYSSVRTEYL